jgi:GTP pyrophosphokinase
MTRIEQATAIATKAHEGQLRISGEPYVMHPIAVQKILESWGMDENTVIAGILHDTVEDTSITLPEIEEAFGKEIAILVDGVTKLTQTDRSLNEMSTYLPSTKDNLLKLLIATGSDIRVLVIKLADRLHNLRTIAALPPARQQKIARESLEIFAPLADRLQMGRVRTEFEDLGFRYADPKRYEQLKKLSEAKLKAADEKLNSAKYAVEIALKKEKIPFENDGRVKSIYSLHKKLAKHGQNIDRIYDLIALRFIVEDVTTCYLALGIVHSLFSPIEGRIKDYVATPKQNGYRSIHTTVITPEGQIVEFQIRTHEMHDYAERGLAASFHYNEQKLSRAYQRRNNTSKLPTNLLWIKELQEATAKLSRGEKVDSRKLKISLFSDKIFVYTPKGDIIDLPKGAFPLDFAFRLHTEIGAKAIGAKINGKIANLNTKLQQGDIVEILTSKNQIPKAGWLDKLFTSHARQKLRQQLSRLQQASNPFTPKPKAKSTKKTKKQTSSKNVKVDKRHSRN